MGPFLIWSSFRRSFNRRLDLVRACPDRLKGDPDRLRARFWSDRLSDDRLIDDWIWCSLPRSPKFWSRSPKRWFGQARTKYNRLLDDRLKDDQIRNTAKEKSQAPRPIVLIVLIFKSPKSLKSLKKLAAFPYHACRDFLKKYFEVV